MTTGCATKPEQKSSGFLTDYSRLSENTFDTLTLGYEKDGVDWGAYDKIMLEQVVLFLDENAVSFEIEAIDSQTNEVLGSAINKIQGKKYKVGKTFTRWGQVEAIFDDFAKLTRKRFEKLGDRQ